MGRMRLRSSVFNHSQPHQIAQNTEVSKTSRRCNAGSQTFAVSYRKGRASGSDDICVWPVVLTGLVQLYTGTADCSWVSQNKMIVSTLY